MKIVIVTGQQGCGKTLNADKIKKLFNASTIVDGENLYNDLAIAERMITSKTKTVKYQGVESNPYYNTTVVVLTNIPVTVQPTCTYVSSVHTFQSLDLK